MSNYINPISISQISEAFSNGSVTPLEFIESICDRIESAEPNVKALLPEAGRRKRLIEEVKKIIEKYPDPSQRPPLFCVPVGIKDLFRADGFPTQAGSSLPAFVFAGKEASFVTKLKQQGAIIIGKTVTTEFAFFEPGPTANPHNINHTPGGSSSGSAAAVAAGYCALASGTQTIGSISRPASYCGIYGFKPSFARIPVDGIIPFSPSLDHAGFFAQNISDIILAASMLCLDWNNSLTTVNESVLPTIGIPEGTYMQQANHEVIEYFTKITDFLLKAGFNIMKLDPFSDIEKINKKHKKLAAFEMAKVHIDWYREYNELYKNKTLELIKEGYTVSLEEIAEAIEGRFILRNYIESLMNDNGIDVWLSPSTLDDAPAGLNSTGSPLMNLPWTYSGLPTISIPAGKSCKSLPLGIQISGIYGKDEMMLAYADIIEKHLPNK